MIKKLLATSLLLVASLNVAHAFSPVRYVQISTNTLTRQSGTAVIAGVDVSTMTVSSATITNMTVTGTVSSITISSVTISTITSVSSATISNLSVTTATIANLSVSTITLVSSATMTNIRVSSVTNSASTQLAGFQSYQLLYSSTVFDVSGSSTTALTGTMVPTRTAITFTPKRSTSQIKITISGDLWTNVGTTSEAVASIFRGSTNLATGGGIQGFCYTDTNSAVIVQATCSTSIWDLPNTASSLTYTVYLGGSGATTKGWGISTNTPTISVEEWGY